MQIILNDSEPKYIQIFKEISRQINHGLLQCNEKLPSKRNLAISLNVSLNTIIQAYDLLLDEGYIYSIEKVGYFVSTQPMVQSTSSFNSTTITKEETVLYDFTTQSLNTFNNSLWKRITRETIDSTSYLKKSPFEGDLGLRTSICKHLLENRGIQVSVNQIFIGSGLEMISNLLPLLDISSITLENPGYHKLSEIGKHLNLTIDYSPMDIEGCIVPQSQTILYTTPFNQFPTGIKMSIGRKKELIQWAQTTNSYIIEDDFDAEFRINASPTSSIYTLNPKCVIFFSTFSTTLFPGLRLAYTILPEALATKYKESYSGYSNTVSTLTQQIVCKFIQSGGYASHINRMKKEYLRRRALCMKTLDDLGISYDTKKNYLSLLVYLPHTITNDIVDKLAKEKQIKVQVLSNFDKTTPTTNTLILGYTAISYQEIPKGIHSLIKALKEIQ